MKTKYPIKVGQTLYNKGTEIKVATIKDMRKIFTEMEHKTGSKRVGVWFPNMKHPTVIDVSQIEV